MKTYLLFFVTISVFLFSCKIEKVTPLSIVGEWKYVGDFSHLADYKCTLCPEFDYDKSIYSLTFNNDLSFNARINLLIGKGNYETTTTDLNESFITGKFNFKNLQILNKPPQTEADTNYMDKLETASMYYLSVNNSLIYDELQLTYDANNYLLFVRNK